MAQRSGYLSDLADEERLFIAPYLVLVREDAPQRQHSSQCVFNAVRHLAHMGYAWR